MVGILGVVHLIKMKPIQAYYLIREVCLENPQLKYKTWPNVNPRYLEEFEKFNSNPFRGFCYVATHVFCHLIPYAVPYFNGTESNGDWKGHWFAKIDDQIWDLTADQIKEPIHEIKKFYDQSSKRNRRPTLTKRCEELLKEVNEKRRTSRTSI